MQLLADQAHIVCFQELGIGTASPERVLANTLEVPKGSHLIVCSPRTGPGSGVAIFLNTLITKYYNVTRPPLSGGGCEGRVIMALLSPRAGGPTILIINLHLGSTWSKRTAQLEAITAQAPTADYYMVLGDWNMTDSPADGPDGYSGLKWSKPFAAAYRSFMDRFRLTERAQPRMTHYAITAPDGKPPSLIATRIDRIFTSHTDSELAATDSDVYLSNPQFSTTRALLMSDTTTLQAKMAQAALNPADRAPTGPPAELRRSLRHALSERISDHDPVTLCLRARNTKLRPQRRLDNVLASTEAFKALHTKVWTTVKTSLSYLALPPPARLACYNDTLYKVQTMIRKRKKATVTAEITAIHKANVAGALIRLFHARVLDCPAIDRILRKHQAWLPKYPRQYQDQPRRAYKISCRLMQRMLMALTTAAFVSDKQEVFGTSAPLGPKGPPDVLASIKRGLATERGGISQLFDPDDKEAPPTADPVRLAAIAVAYYRRQWQPPARLATEEEITTYLGRPRHPPSDQPMPSKEDLCDVIINHKKNKCPGPNGISFEAYKATAPHAIEVLYDMLKFLAEGNAPPPAFNSALLFLLPKDTSYTVEATRPISVNNTDNRILARVTALAVSPLLQDRLHPCQKGCVAGRSSIEGLREMVDEFYARVKSDTQSYLLLLDFRKAFDSVQHEFILAAARHQGMPEWFVKILQGLFHEATATPVLGGQRAAVALAILRGVKQGCALSVIAFLLTIDVLLWRLHPQPDADLTRRMLAYMDDVSFQVTARGILAEFMATTNAFTDVSQMSVNQTKTQLLTAKPRSAQDCQWLASSAWPSMTSPPSGKLLGLVIGRKVTAAVVYKAAFAKYYARLRAYKPALRLIPGHLRPLVFNVFVLPVLLYLAQFYLPWYGAKKEEPATIRAARHYAHSTIAPFHGTAYSYTASINPTGLGLPIPVKDLWATTYAMQASQCTVEELQLEAGNIPTLPAASTPPPALISAEHRLEAMREVRYRATLVAGGAEARYDPEPMLEAQAKGPAALRRYMYNVLIKAYLIDTGERGANRPRAMTKVLKNRELAPAALTVLDVNTQALRPIIPPRFFYSHFLNIHNGLVTTSRLEPITGTPALICQICCLPGTRDRLAHIVTECPYVRVARSCVLRWAGCPTVPQNQPTTPERDKAYRAHVLLATKYPVKPTLTAAVHLFVNHAAWTLSRRCLPMRRNDTWQQKATLISDYAAHQILQCAKKGKWTDLQPAPGLGLRDRMPSLRLRRGATSAERKATEHLTSMAIFDRLLQSGAEFLAVGTDGSARPTNPGPAGAGTVIQRYDARGALLATTTIHEGLGEGTNNEGEFYALGIATEYILERLPHMPTTTPIYIQSDSQLAVGVLNHISCPTALSTRGVAHAVRGMYRRLCERFSLVFTRWCPAHMNNPINEASDEAANLGSTLSAEGRGLTPETKAQKIRTSNFLPVRSQFSTQRHLRF